MFARSSGNTIIRLNYGFLCTSKRAVHEDCVFKKTTMVNNDGKV